MIVLTVSVSLLYLVYVRQSSLSPSLCLALLALVIAFVALSVVSFIDDLRGLPAAVRFAVQIATAIAVVMLLRRPDDSPLASILTAVAVAWITGYTNAFNFMDGINGIASLQAAITGLGTALVATQLGLMWDSPVVAICLAVAGAACGFLPHNFPRAKIFMGDVSSASLGFLLAVIAFWISQQTTWWALFWVGLLHANFVLDTGITLVRRALRGEKIATPHREHFYQRLIRGGRSHTFVSLAESALQVLATSMIICATGASWMWKVWVAVAVIGMWLAFFAFAERQFVAARTVSQAPA